MGSSAELGGQLVDQRLERERRLRPARAAVGTGPEPIRLDAVGTDVVGVPAVGARDEDPADALDGPFGEGAGVEHEPRTQPGESAVLRRPDLELDDRARRRVRHREVLAPGEGEANRAAQGEGRARGQRLGDEDLGPERAAERAPRPSGPCSAAGRRSWPAASACRRCPGCCC